MPAENARGVEPLEFALVTGPGARVDGHAVWRTPCETPQGPRNLYLKSLDPRRLLIELFCSQIGRALALPIPRPYIVVARPRTIEPTFPDVTQLLFGCREEAHPALSAFTRQADEVVGILRRWTKVRDAAAFDSLIANEDRTAKNFLFGAAEHALWLIDHEDALRDTFEPGDITRNEILQLLTSGLSEFELHKLLRDTRRASDQAIALPLGELDEDPAIEKISDAARHAVGLAGFLSTRCPLLPRILLGQINPKQQELTHIEQPARSVGRSDTPV